MSNHRNVSCGLELPPSDVLAPDKPLSTASAAALATATRIARDDGAALHLLTALDFDFAADWMLQDAKLKGGDSVVERARARLVALAATAQAAGLRVTIETSTRSPADALLVDAAQEHRDLIVVGTRERGSIVRNLLGSTALSLLRRATVPVWVARTAYGDKPPTVLAAIDLGDMAPRVVAAAAHAAAAAGGTLHVLHVVDFSAEDVLRTGSADLEFVTEYRRRKREDAEVKVPEIVANACASGPKATIHLRYGDVRPTILGVAEEVRADLVVIASVVHGALGAAISGLGRTAEHVLPRLPTSLLVLKP